MALKAQLSPPDQGAALVHGEPGQLWRLAIRYEDFAVVDPDIGPTRELARARELYVTALQRGQQGDVAAGRVVAEDDGVGHQSAPARMPDGSSPQALAEAAASNRR